MRICVRILNPKLWWLAFSRHRHYSILISLLACGFPRPPDVGPDSTPGGPKYQLWALAPNIAAADDTIALEGTFGSTVAVNFPGGVSQSATVLSDHRAVVVVPASATSGMLSVTTGGTIVGSLTFRRASFTLGLQTFQPFYDQAGVTRQDSTLLTKRSAATGVVVGNYIYVIGGSDSTGYLDNVERARINADGSLTPFISSNVRLATARAGHTCVVLGIFLYIVGGVNNTGILGSVERASIAPDGSLGQFTIVPNLTLDISRKDATSVVLGNALYVIGGTGNGVLDSIERATINADGSLGPFARVADVTLATARTGHASMIAGNALYVVGGSGTSGVTGTVERAIIADDGSLGVFAQVTGVGLVTARAGHTGAVIGNSLYVLGGIGDPGALTSIEQATLYADGTIGAFTIVPGTLVTARSSPVSVMAGNFLYLLGGSGAGGTYLSSLERASINAGGDLSSFSIVPNIALTKPDLVRTSLVVGSSLYTFELNAINRADINEDGSLGPFAPVIGTSLDPNYGDYSIAVVRDKMYLVGGSHSPASTIAVDNIVEEATINADYSLSPFTPVAGVFLNNARAGAMSAIVGDILYVIGGFRSDFTYENSIERAIIGSDGSLGQFAVVGTTAITGRIGAVSVLLGKFLYVIGGNGIDAQTSIERAPINPDGSLGGFATVPSVALASPRSSHTAAVVGGYLYLIGGLNSSDMMRSVERAPIGIDGSLGPFALAPVTLDTGRLGVGSITIGNRLYVFGGLDVNLELDASIEQAILQ